MAVDELDVSLEKQESKGLVTIQRPTPTIVTESPIVDTLEDSPTASNKKVKLTQNTLIVFVLNSMVMTTFFKSRIFHLEFRYC